jgi:hypothetical protein
MIDHVTASHIDKSDRTNFDGCAVSSYPCFIGYHVSEKSSLFLVTKSLTDKLKRGKNISKDTPLATIFWR